MADALIVTTAHGRYRVEETARGWFVFTLLDARYALATVQRAPLRLGVGLGLCYDVDGVQQVDCDCNRITALEP